MPHFNWALDYFDPMPVGNENPALWIVEESGEECRLSFAALATRSNQVANWLRAQGVQRGDRLLLMLGNEAALWEVMLAAIKLGVVLIPTASLLARDDLRDRITRGGVRPIAGSAMPEVDALEATHAYCVGETTAADGLRPPALPANFTPDVRRGSDPCSLFTRARRRAKLGSTRPDYPVGISDHVLDRLRPGTHLTSRPRVASTRGVLCAPGTQGSAFH